MKKLIFIAIITIMTTSCNKENAVDPTNIVGTVWRCYQVDNNTDYDEFRFSATTVEWWWKFKDNNIPTSEGSKPYTLYGNTISFTGAYFSGIFDFNTKTLSVGYESGTRIYKKQ